MSIRVYYLEDDEALAFITQKALQKRGYEVCHFSNIQEAKQEKEIERFTYAILDLKVEDGHALSMVEHLLLQNPHLKILILTAYASVATAVQAIKLGAVNYLAKPATIEQILAALEDELETSNSVPDEELDEDKPSLKRLEWEQIQQALVENNGNISATARQLNMHRRTLQRKLNKKPVTR